MKNGKKIFLIIFIIIIAVIVGYVIFNMTSNPEKEEIDNNMKNEVSNNDEIIENNSTNSTNNLSSQLETNIQKQENEGENKMSKLNIRVGNKNYTATLYDNEITKALLKEMPLTINMSELHGNEKYYYFNQSFPTNSERITNINTGDIMLFGSDCLVLFYDDFSTSYSYTKIGHIDNPENLANELGTGSVQVTFEEN